MQKQKICFIVSSAFTAKAFLVRHIEALSENFDVYLAGNFSGDDMPILNSLKIKGYKHIPINRKIKPAEDIKAVLMLMGYFRRMKFASVHSVTPKAGLLTAAAGVMAGIKIRIHIFTGQVWHTRKGLFRYILKQTDRAAALMATHILVDGPSQRSYLISEGVIKKENSQVFADGSISGVDVSVFRPEAAAGQKIRNELNIAEHRIVFLFLGRINRDKGIIELVEAFRRLRKINHRVFLLLAGFDEEQLIPYIKQRLSEDDFYYYGPAAKPEEIYQACDVFCLPSHREGFGSSVIEASACAKAVIASDTYGLLDAVREYETGLRHKAGNADSLFRMMHLLAENGELRARLGKNGLHFVRKHFSSGLITSCWTDFYNSLLSTEQLAAGYRNAYCRIFKPAGDLIFSLLLLILTSPVILLSALLLFMVNSGKVFFIQERPGLNGVPFSVIKFRTMNDSRDEKGNLMPDEQRLTSIGKIIRGLSIDELLQLINVLKGEMSIIGPRPLLMDYMPLYNSFQKKRHLVKPGITGWAQVNGRNTLSWDRRFQLDVEYVENISFSLDVKIALMTILKVLKKEGISSANSVTMERFSGTN